MIHCLKIPLEKERRENAVRFMCWPDDFSPNRFTSEGCDFLLMPFCKHDSMHIVAVYGDQFIF